VTALPDIVAVLLFLAVCAGGLAVLSLRLLDRGSRFLPLLLAIAACGVMVTVTAGAPAPLWSIGVMFACVFDTIAAAAATPLPIIEGVVSLRRKVATVVCTFVTAGPLTIALFVNPEVWVGGPAPLLADRLPLFVGWLFDRVMNAVPPVEIFGFDPVFALLLWFGFYLELLIAATVVCGLIRLVFVEPERVPARGV
jgi:hypothetical protein